MVRGPVQGFPDPPIGDRERRENMNQAIWTWILAILFVGSAVFGGWIYYDKVYRDAGGEEAVEEDFRQRQAVEETAERSAQEGDHVYIRLSAKRFEEAEDEQAEEGNLIDERSTSVIIAAEGAETPSEWPFVGFSRELIGMSSGEDKSLVFTSPEWALIRRDQ